MVGRILGHRSLVTTQRYAHISDEDARAAVDALCEPVTQKVTQSQAGASKVVKLRRK